MADDSSENTFSNSVQDDTKSSEQFSEKTSKSNLSDPAELVHHAENTVCNVELIPTQKKKVRNVLTRMKDENLRGPLQVMRRCMMENIKVKVLTRNYKHVRGICTGYILAFDKHWNLALKDVDEVYKNPIPRPQIKKRRRKNTQKTVESDRANNSRSFEHSKPYEPENGSSIATSHTVGASSECSDNREIDSRCRESSSLEILARERQCIVKELQELSCAPSSSSENEFDFGRESSSRKHSTKELQSSGSKRLKSSNSAVARSSRTPDKDTSKADKLYKDQDKRSKSRWTEKRVDYVQHEKSDRGLYERNFDSSRQNRLTDKFHGNLSRETSCNTDKSGLKSHRSESKRFCDDETEHQSWLTRHVNQLFIRGDNVVLVSLLDS